MRAPSARPAPRPAFGLVLLLVLAAGCAGGHRDSETGAPQGAAELPAILAHANSALRDGDYEEAQKAYEAALAIDPDHAAAVTNLGTCYLHNRLIGRARDLLTAHLARHPGNTAARLVLARVHIRRSDLDAAAEALRGVLKTGPDSLVARYNLGFIAYRSGRLQEAEEQLLAAIALRPDHAESHYTLGLVRLATGRLDEAIASLEKAAALDPRHVGARFNLANAYARAGRMAEARAMQEEYAGLSGRSKAEKEREAQISASSVAAIRHLQAGRFAEALAAYEALAAGHPDYAPLRNEIGRLQIRLGRKDEALESLRKAVALDPSLGEPHYLLAGLYQESGDTAAAERELATFAALSAIPEGKSGY